MGRLFFCLRTISKWHYGKFLPTQKRIANKSASAQQENINFLPFSTNATFILPILLCVLFHFHSRVRFVLFALLPFSAVAHNPLANAQMHDFSRFYWFIHYGLFACHGSVTHLNELMFHSSLTTSHRRGILQQNKNIEHVIRAMMLLFPTALFFCQKHSPYLARSYFIKSAIDISYIRFLVNIIQ